MSGVKLLHHPEASKFHRALVLPLEVDPWPKAVSKDRADRGEQALLGYLAERGKTVDAIRPSEARSAWSEAARDCKHGAAGRHLRRSHGASRRVAIALDPLVSRPNSGAH
jgi:hypothetical protein